MPASTYEVDLGGGLGNLQLAKRACAEITIGPSAYSVHLLARMMNLLNRKPELLSGSRHEQKGKAWKGRSSQVPIALIQ